MAVFDTTFLARLFYPDIASSVQNSPAQSQDERNRIDYLVERLSNSNERIVVPTPALSEFLIPLTPGERSKYIQLFERDSNFKIESFDTRAAIELAEVTARHLAGGDKRGGVASPWQKVKYDRQIAGIAKVAGETDVYSSDGDLKTIAMQFGLRFFNIEDLPLPPVESQGSLDL